ncbi:MAG TPA: hypothetical protein VH482_09180 [Thermomicrobiales bacterium]|jgi:hypothetical protein
MDDFADFEVIGTEEFDALPRNGEQRRYPAIWDPALDALEFGDAVRIPCRDDGDGCDTGRDLVRRARARGITIEVRYGEGFVAARKRDRETATSPSRSPPACARATAGNRDRSPTYGPRNPAR